MKKVDFQVINLQKFIKIAKGNIWFTTVDKGIIKYNGERFIIFSEEDGLLNNEVLTFFEDKDGLYWIGTKEGVTTFNGRNFFQFSEKKVSLKLMLKLFCKIIKVICGLVLKQMEFTDTMVEK